MMKRLTCENPQTNTEILLNFAYAKNGKVYLRWADGMENADLCEYIANNACCAAVDADAVMDGACLECDSRASALYRTAVQAAELRARLVAYEDTGLTPEEIDMDHEAAENLRRLCQLCDLDRLEELAKADKDGRLVVLPCKVGDTIFVAGRDGIAREMRMQSPNIRTVCTDEDNLCMATCNRKPDGFCAYRLRNDGEDIGKSVFLTREEAEAALTEYTHE